MKTRCVLLSLLLSLGLSAEPSSHERVAGELLDLVSGPEMFRTGFMMAIEPMIAKLQADGAPDEMIEEIKAACHEWLDQDMPWSEMKPAMAALYVREFTEPELLEILRFYRTPTGQKALKKVPALFQEAAKIGQTLAAQREYLLMERLQKIHAKYQSPTIEP